MEEKDYDRDAKIEFIEYSIDRYNNILSSFNRNTKKWSDMNTTLNWATTILTALFVYYSGKAIDSNIFISILFSYSTALIYFIFIICYALFKVKTIALENSMGKILSETYENIISIKCDLRYDKIQATENNIPITNIFCEEINKAHLYLTDNNIEKIVQTSHKKVEILSKNQEVLFIINLCLFGLYMCLLPIYFILK